MSAGTPTIPKRLEKVLLYSAIGLGLAFIGCLDYSLDPQLNLFPFYFIPVATAAWHGRQRLGVITSILATGLWFGVNYKIPHLASSPFAFYWNGCMRLIAFITVAILTARLGDELRKLQQLLPICAWCRKIRNDTGYWERVEDYFSKRDHTKFSHGICPECSEKFWEPNVLFVEKDQQEMAVLKESFLKAGLPHILHGVESVGVAMEWMSGGRFYSDRTKYPIPDIIIVDAESDLGCFYFIKWLGVENRSKITPVLLVDSLPNNATLQKAQAEGVTCFAKSPSYHELCQFLQSSSVM